MDRLDPGLSKRPSRFDRKYKFNLPNRSERILYCDFWRKKLSSNKAIEFPKKLCPAIADITEDFSFAYLKEAFVATLLVIAGREDEDERHAGSRSGSDAAAIGDARDGGKDKDGDDDDLDDLILWVEMQKQVKLLRDDMDSGDDDTATPSTTTAVSFDPNPKQSAAANARATHLPPPLPLLPRRRALPGAWTGNLSSCGSVNAAGNGNGNAALVMPDAGEGSVSERLERLRVQTMRGMGRDRDKDTVEIATYLPQFDFFESRWDLALYSRFEVFLPTNKRMSQ